MAHHSTFTGHVMFFNFSFIDFYVLSRFGHPVGPVDRSPVKRMCAFYDIFSKSKPILLPPPRGWTREWMVCEQVRLNLFGVGGNPSPTWLKANQPSGVTIWMKKGTDVCGMFPSPAVNVVSTCVCVFFCNSTRLRQLVTRQFD